MTGDSYRLKGDSYTVEIRSKGPGRKGNSSIREKISSPIKHFPIYFYIGSKGISVYGKNKAGPLKSLGVKFHCRLKGDSFRLKQDGSR